MRWTLLLVVVTAVAAVATAVYVVLDNRDPVPADTLACVRKQKLELTRSSAALEIARQDAIRGELRPTRRWDWGRTNGVLLQGPAKNYAVLALWNADTPSLAGGDIGRRVYASPGRFPVVSAESPVLGRLALCARQQSD